MTIEDLHRQYNQALQTIYSHAEAQAITGIAFEHFLQINKTLLRTHKHLSITKDKAEQMTSILNKLMLQTPIQHLCEEQWFCHQSFKVNKHVLIPRPETEELVLWVNRIIHSHTHIKTLIDIGTGSGCIALSVKKYCPWIETSALDISAEALAIAQENALCQKATISFYQRDILQESQWQDLPQYDIIISNPPYITPAEKKDMHPNVLQYEPDTALFVSAEQPLIFYEKIISFAHKHLNNRGYIFFEINELFGKEMYHLLQENKFSNIQLKKDMQGKNRMIMGELIF